MTIWELSLQWPLAMTYGGIQQSFYTKFFARGVTGNYVPDLHLQVVLKMHMCMYVDWSEDCLRAWHCGSVWLSWTPSLCKGKEHACGKRSKALWNFCSVPRGKRVAEFCVNCRSVSPDQYSGHGVVFIHNVPALLLTLPFETLQLYAILQ
jgi:hypothetical protein